MPVTTSSLSSRLFAGLFLAAGSLAAFACSSGSGDVSTDAVFTEPSPDAGEPTLKTPTDSFPSGRVALCQGLECQQVECGGNVTTTLTGTVTAPNGTLPLYNAIVFVPNAPLDPLSDGLSCDRCGSVSGKPIVSALTDVNGHFVLKDVPAGENIPLVIQIGKWRRQVTVPSVTKCVENPITNPDLTRLPRNHEEGDIPRIAVTTGRCDQLACLLPKLGLDAKEFTPSTGDGRLHLYRGATHNKVPAPAPTGTLDATELYSNADLLKKYDMLLLSCECGEHDETKSDDAKAAMYTYASTGGRVFASHFHYTWASEGPLSTAAQWVGSEKNPENPPGPFLVDRSFPKGDALANWLVSVDATKTLGEIPISQPREDVGAVHSAAQRWVYSDTSNASLVAEMPVSTKYLSINTPVAKPVADQCGKFVFADMHLYGGDVQDPKTALPDNAFPTSCGTELTPEEKALAFLFFDLSSCVQDDTKPPVPPVH
jgi:hypothetical protein